MNDADQNVAVGYAALNALTTGSSNVAIGDRAGVNNTTGYQNVFIGDSAGDANVAADGNVAVGYLALTAASHADADRNTAIGVGAGQSITQGNQNTAVGGYAMGEQTGNAITGNNNTCLGYAAGYVLEGAAHSNTLVGMGAGSDMSTGLENTCVGFGAGNAITTGDNNIVIGKGADTSAVDSTNVIVMGEDMTAATNFVSIGSSAGGFTGNHTNASAWGYPSDVRRKHTINSSNLGLNFINDLRTVTYKLLHCKDRPEEWGQFTVDDDGNKVYPNFVDTDELLYGMIAQEVKEAIDTAGSDATNFSGWTEKETGEQHLSYSMFVFPLIKSVQELSEKNEALEKRIEELENN